MSLCLLLFSRPNSLQSCLSRSFRRTSGHPAPILLSDEARLHLVARRIGRRNCLCAPPHSPSAGATARHSILFVNRHHRRPPRRRSPSRSLSGWSFLRSGRFRLLYSPRLAHHPPRFSDRARNGDLAQSLFRNYPLRNPPRHCQRPHL